MKRSTYYRPIENVLFVAALLVPLWGAYADDAKTPAPPAPPPVVKTQHAAKEIANPITQGFIDKGVKSCAGRINQVTNFLLGGAPAGAALFLPPSAPNKNMVSGSVEMLENGSQSVYGSVTVAPNQANGCGAQYEAVTWWPMACDKLAATQFAGQKMVGVLKKNISVLALGPSTKLFLMPTTDGCISIKKELVSR